MGEAVLVATLTSLMFERLLIESEVSPSLIKGLGMNFAIIASDSIAVEHIVLILRRDDTRVTFGSCQVSVDNCNVIDAVPRKIVAVKITLFGAPGGLFFCEVPIVIGSVLDEGPREIKVVAIEFFGRSDDRISPPYSVG
jgi:hypothetical protein